MKRFSEIAKEDSSKKKEERKYHSTYEYKAQTVLDENGNSKVVYEIIEKDCKIQEGATVLRASDFDLSNLISVGATELLQQTSGLLSRDNLTAADSATNAASSIKYKDVNIE